MDAQRICSVCGKTLAPDAPEGLCPECLLKAGFGTGVDIGPDSGDKAPRFSPPKIEELAAKFGQLEILEFIGQGGMGAVYKARQKQLDRTVALKILPPQARGAAFAERFTREARALAKLNHPHIVTLYEFGQSDGLFYFLMEFVDGVNLRQLLRNSRISPREALAIVPQICEALQFAHDSGIVHRDIKPENILLDKKGQVKIADFGVSKMIAESVTDVAEKTVTTPGELTQAGSTLGTPQYMAPEQIKNSAEVDHRADIYSLGVVFYQMLTGELPSGKIEPPSSRMRGIQIDVRLDEIVMRALEKEPGRRYQHAGEIGTVIETIALTSANQNPGNGKAVNTKSDQQHTMNDIQFNCPHCRQSLTADTTSAGTAVACPQCGQTILVPKFTKSSAKTPSRVMGPWLAALGAAVLLLVVTGLLLSQKHGRSGQTVTIPDPHLKAAVLSALGLSSGPITAAEMLALTNLSASGSNIQDITGLQYAANLTYLDISQNDLANLSPLAGLTNLGALYLNDNRVADLWPLGGLTSLTRLNMANNQILDLRPLTQLSRLSQLNASNNQIADLKPLTGLTNLETLDLNNNQVVDLRPLAGLTSLTQLNVANNQIVDLRPMARLVHLSQFDMANNQITDLRPLTGTTNLSYLFTNNLSSQASLTDPETISVSAIQEKLAHDSLLYFNFDSEPAMGKVLDLSGHGNDGEAVNVQWIADGHRGGCIQFGLTNSYIRVPDNDSVNPTNFTLAAWIKTSFTDYDWRRIFDKGTAKEFDLTMGGDDYVGGPNDGRTWRGEVSFEVARQDLPSGVRVADGRWHQVVGTFDGSNLRLYIDGRLVGSPERAKGQPKHMPYDLTIGANRSLGAPEEIGQSFNGLMDDVMMLDCALSPAEVAALYDSQKTASDAGNEP